MSSLLIKMFYDGRSFHGSQRQPDVRTVEGEIIKTLSDEGIAVERIVFSGRTDKGVHALSQIALLEAFASNEKVLEALTKLPKDILVWAIRFNLPFEYNPRYNVVYRRYVYVEEGYENLDLIRLNNIAKMFIGKHMFNCFSSYYEKIPPYISPYRTVFSFKIYRAGKYIIYDIVADSFIKQMVRRIVSTMRLFEENIISEADIKNMLKGKCLRSLRIKPAKPESLILFDIETPLTFKVLEEKLREVFNYCCKAENIALNFICSQVKVVGDKPKIKV